MFLKAVVNRTENDYDGIPLIGRFEPRNRNQQTPSRTASGLGTIEQAERAVVTFLYRMTAILPEVCSVVCFPLCVPVMS